MFVGSLLKGTSVAGYIENNLLEPRSIRSRHRALADEMKRRGFRHRSPLPRFTITGLDRRAREFRVDVASSARDLASRCGTCRSRMNEKSRTGT